MSRRGLSMFLKTIAACAAVLPCGTFAEPKAPLSCTSPSPKSTLEINECAMRKYKARDRDMNEAYKALTASLKPVDASDTTDYAAVETQLMAAQKSWVAFRDADCNALRKFYEQGTIRTVLHVGCLIDRTVQRTKELKAWLPLAP